MSRSSAFLSEGPLEGCQGGLEGKDLHVAILVSRYNAIITGRLLKGAKEALLGHGVTLENCEIFTVPGCLELPLLALKLAKSDDYDALVALGAVIKGETAHFEYVCQESSAGLMCVALKTGLPIGFGVLTTYDEGQALERSGGRWGNKGEEAALVAVEMANLLRKIHKKKDSRQ